ncbi:Predicted transcriptional regulator [Pustulibacterium marinum]|uniref:Predicted transcriptional regulator n=1 Tax=Pustulibacterium marinum TaxID=1224947 RepID=A0A1I7HWH9_9FLAO|nr:BlaI/MecI/CopY family transcriptional regulator [Pustulibacterium marinum]SFU65043.1 Predicted transcriptional regulator [Pustulibacterium marinum]
MDIKQLNKSELQIMKYLWKLEKGFMKDIVSEFPEPKPAYTTISTLLSRMCKKGYVDFEKLGRDKLYYPVLEKESYFSGQVKSMISNFFDNSASQFASFFTKDKNMSIEELEEIEKLVQKSIQQKKADE